MMEKYKQLTSSIFLKLPFVIKKYPERLLDVCGCFNSNQFKCKLWLVEKLNSYSHHFKMKTKDKIDIAIFGGWYGTMATIIKENFTLKPIRNVFSYDYDPLCKKIGQNFFSDITFVEEDVNNIAINEKSFSIIINTSCEHFEQHEIDAIIEKSPANTLFVLQSTNYIEVDQHINCSASLHDFVNRYDKKLHNIKIYEMQLEKYKRFMILGVKS